MAIMFLSTIGGRDLLLEGREIKPPRIEGKRILDDLETLAPKLSLPMLEAAIDYILRREEAIDRIVLIATDQPKTELPRHRDNDTLFFAEIIKKLLVKKLLVKNRKVKDIRVFLIKQNPSNVDDMFDFFKQALKRNKAFQMKNMRKCYALTTGGVPGANTALLMQSIEYYREKCYPLYVSEKTGHVIPLQIGNQMLTSFRNEAISRALDRYDYSAVAALLADQSNERERFCWRLAEYAKHRLYFDFDTALSITENTMGEVPAGERSFCEYLQQDLDGLKNKERSALVRELFLNLRIKFIREEFVDFLGRVFRLQEDVLRYIVEKQFGFSTEMDKKSRYAEFVNGVKKNTALTKYLEESRFSGKPLKYDEPTIPCLTQMVKFLVEVNDNGNGKPLITDEGQIQSYRQIIEIFEKVNGLSGLRNKSIIAHGYDGVSRAILQEKYGEGDIITDLRRVVGLIGVDLKEDPFERINDRVKRTMDLKCPPSTSQSRGRS